MTSNLKEAKSDAKKIKKSAIKNIILAANRLALLKHLKVKVGELADELPDELHQREMFEHMATIRLKIK